MRISSVLTEYGLADRASQQYSRSTDTPMQIEHLLSSLPAEQGAPFSREFAEVLGDGWYPHEANHVWSRAGETAQILTPGRGWSIGSGFEVLIRGFAGGAFFNDQVSIRVCGQVRDDFADALREGDGVWVPLSSTSECMNHPALELYTPEQPNPLEAGLNRDTRNLGIMVSRIRHHE